MFVVPAVPITNNRELKKCRSKNNFLLQGKTVKGYRDLKTDGSKNRVERLKRLDALNVSNLEGSKKRVRESDASSVSPQMKKKKVIGKVAIESSAAEPSRLSPKDYIPNDEKSCRQLVLKLLSPYFNAGKFADKTHFKELAKKITESLVKVIAFTKT